MIPLILCMLAASGSVAAESTADQGPAGHSLDLLVGTDFPVMLGGGLSYESPQRLRAMVHGGYLPGPYLDSINWGLTTFDVYSDTVATLIDEALQDAFVLRGELGYRPLARRGLVLSAGYQRLGLIGDTTEVSALTSNMEGGLSDGLSEAAGEITVAIVAHEVSLGLGYEWLVRDRVVVRPSLGFAYTLGARTTVAPTEETRSTVQEELMGAVVVLSEDYLDFVFEEWVHLPMIGLYAGYRFR